MMHSIWKLPKEKQPQALAALPNEKLLTLKDDYNALYRSSYKDAGNTPIWLGALGGAGLIPFIMADHFSRGWHHSNHSTRTSFSPNTLKIIGAAMAGLAIGGTALTWQFNHEKPKDRAALEETIDLIDQELSRRPIEVPETHVGDIQHASTIVEKPTLQSRPG
jgi:hypothetical protein